VTEQSVAPARADLVGHLVATRICGDVATSRQTNLTNARLCAEGHPGFTFGVEFRRPWTYPEVVAELAKRVGICPDLGYESGQDRIDPQLCVDRLEAMGERLGTAARRRERVLLATGHPTGLLAIHLKAAAALRSAGVTLLAPAPGWSYRSRDQVRHIRHIGGVAMLSNGAGLLHTHDPQPMRGMLAVLDESGEPPPDLVVADHGYAGAAGQAGIDTVGFADCNDPALFLAEAEGTVRVAVPLDDNLQPHLYGPVSDYLLSCM
jgi:hypothetical protein